MRTCIRCISCLVPMIPMSHPSDLHTGHAVSLFRRGPLPAFWTNSQMSPPPQAISLCPGLPPLVCSCTSPLSPPARHQSLPLPQVPRRGGGSACASRQPLKTQMSVTSGMASLFFAPCFAPLPSSNMHLPWCSTVTSLFTFRIPDCKPRVCCRQGHWIF